MQTTEKISSAESIRKTDPEDYDLVILGGGTGSTVAAWTFASEGKRVAVVDRKYIGGSCPNIACLPSKNIIHSAKVASYFRRSREFGITHDGFTIDMSGVRERKRKMVTSLNQNSIGGLKLILSGPGASGSRSMPDGRQQELGGWNRVLLQVQDLPARIDRQGSYADTWSDLLRRPG